MQAPSRARPAAMPQEEQGPAGQQHDWHGMPYNQKETPKGCLRQSQAFRRLQHFMRGGAQHQKREGHTAHPKHRAQYMQRQQ